MLSKCVCLLHANLSNSMYTVVEFLEDNTVKALPVSWIVVTVMKLFVIYFYGYWCYF